MWTGHLNRPFAVILSSPGTSLVQQQHWCIATHSSGNLIQELAAHCCPLSVVLQFSKVSAGMQGVSAHVRKCESEPNPSLLRTLQQAPETSGSQQVAHVKTPRDFQEALAAGKRHIEIREHLDLTTIETIAGPIPGSLPDLFGLDATSSTFSIRVRSSCLR
jgi:hypothetical protein